MSEMDFQPKINMHNERTEKLPGELFFQVISFI